jgi:hypothetical protein
MVSRKKNAGLKQSLRPWRLGEMKDMAGDPDGRAEIDLPKLKMSA